MTDPKASQPTELNDNELEAAAGAGAEGELKQIQTQTYMERKDKALDTLSNIVKKSSDTNSTIVGNLK